MRHSLIETLRKNLAVFVLLLICIFSAWTKYDFVQKTIVEIPFSADAIDYYFAAYNLKKYGTYSRKIVTSDSPAPQPDALRPPGYSLFLYPFVDLPLTMPVLRAIQYSQIALSVLCLPLLFFAVRRLIPDTYLLLAVFTLAISPHLTVVNLYFLSEALYSFSLVLIVSIFAWWIKTNKHLLCLFLGAALAFSALVRPTSLYLIVFLLPTVWFMAQPIWRVRLLALVILGFAFVYSPWIVRNQLSDIEPSRSLAIDTVQKGMYPGLMYQNDPETFAYPNKFDPEWSARSKDMTLVLQEVVRRFQEQPAEHIRWYLLGKPISFLSWGIVVGMGDVFIFPVVDTNMYTDPLLHTSYLVSKALHWPLTVLALLMCFMLFLPSSTRNTPANQLLFFRGLAVIFAYFILVHMVGTPLPRYSIPIRSIVYLMAFGLIALLPVVWRSRHVKETDDEARN